jgi:hypothetical protein
MSQKLGSLARKLHKGGLDIFFNFLTFLSNKPLKKARPFSSLVIMMRVKKAACWLSFPAKLPGSCPAFMYSFSGNCAASVPNFHIFLSVSDLYVPRIGPHIFCCRKGRSIVKIYKSLTDT